MPQLPVQITFRDMTPSTAVEAHVRRRADKLDTFFDQIMGCRVAVEAPLHRHHHGRRYEVRVDITVPGHELVVRRDPTSAMRTAEGKQATGNKQEFKPDEDLYAAIDGAFDDAERVLEDHARKLRREVKRNKGAKHGIVTKIFAEQGYGFLQSDDEPEIYFHRNSVLDGEFDNLHVGSEVRYAEEFGEKGLQASTVALHGKRQHRT